MLIQGRQTVQIEGSSLSSRRLHFNVTKSSTISGANLFLSGVTTLPATENTRSDLEEAAGMGKMTLANILPRPGDFDPCPAPPRRF